jgi:hypothetical protein
MEPWRDRIHHRADLISDCGRRRFHPDEKQILLKRGNPYLAGRAGFLFAGAVMDGRFGMGESIS